MSDDLKNRGEQDGLRIDVHEEHEVRQWTNERNIAFKELEGAVKDAGVLGADVRNTQASNFNAATSPVVHRAHA